MDTLGHVNPKKNIFFEFSYTGEFCTNNLLHANTESKKGGAPISVAHYAGSARHFMS